MSGKTMLEEESAGEGLTYPSRDWRGFFREHFGPSMLWALIGIGVSHIVLAPTLGATFGLFAVWVFGLIYLAKYGAWELGSGTTTARARIRSRATAIFQGRKTGRCGCRYWSLRACTPRSRPPRE